MRIEFPCRPTSPLLSDGRKVVPERRFSMHPSSAKPATFSQRVQAAAQYLQRGQFSEAEKMLQALTRQAPADPDVLQLSGVLPFSAAEARRSPRCYSAVRCRRNQTSPMCR